MATPTRAAPEKRADKDFAIYVGGLCYDVTGAMLCDLFRDRYPSVMSATVVRDAFSGHSKGYGFVVFGDVNERREAMTAMNGEYCSTRPMRIGPANGIQQWVNSDCDESNKRLFVGGLDLSVTAEDLNKAFSPYGEITDAKLIEGKSCGFVTYTSRASAEEAMRILNGSQLGDNTIRVLWARRLSNKQDEANGVYHGRPEGSGYGCYPEDPNMHGYTDHEGYAYHQQKQPQQTPVQ